MLYALYFSEIVLKGGNRGYFTSVLYQNIQKTLKNKNWNYKISSEQNRFLLEIPDIDTKQVIDLLRHISGLDVVMPCYPMDRIDDHQQLGDAVLDKLSSINYDRLFAGQSFALRVRRVDKRYIGTSADIARIIGGKIKEHYNLKINLSNPAVEIYIEILNEKILLGIDRIGDMLSGLPLGTSGTVLSLLSGGIDSPVASLMMIRRGARVVAIHCHTVPQTSPESIEKVKQLAKIISSYQSGKMTVYMVSVLDMQLELARLQEVGYRTILLRRGMMKIADTLAKKLGIKAIITGDSLGQVASQTLENMTAVEQGIDMPILRPLVGMNKADIIAESEKRKLYKTSILPYDDCCGLFTPKKPITKADSKVMTELDNQINWDKLVEISLNKTEKIDLF